MSKVMISHEGSGLQSLGIFIKGTIMAPVGDRVVAMNMDTKSIALVRWSCQRRPSKNSTIKFGLTNILTWTQVLHNVALKILKTARKAGGIEQL